MSKLKLISVTDTQLPTSLLESINELRNSGLFCDVTIIVQDRKFQAHRLMLAASSSYFRQLFSVAKQVIELNFIKADIFQEVLNYIYSSKITRIRSDKLEDLINAGQVLGVNFIANLATPLAQVKSLPGLSKDTENSNASTAEKSESGTKNMPIITESFSLSAEEFGMVNNSAVENEDSDNDDVLFVSTTEVPKPQKTKPTDIIDVDLEEPEAKKQKLSNKEGRNPEVPKPQKPNSNIPSQAEVREIIQDKPQPHQITSSPPQPPPPPPPPVILPKISTSTIFPAPSGRCFPQSAPSIPIQANADTINSCLPPETSEILGVQKKQVMLEQSSDRPGKIKLSDVRPSFGIDNGSGLDVTLTKKTITLDKASEIDSLSEGCKVYANIGENTYDIVPEKEYITQGETHTPSGKKKQTSVEGASNVSGTPPSPQGKKKGKEKDHYELVMDGKTFFVCAVCKRPYVCLTSLRRHFNTHSWERKYPCRYCDKVFALAEYRTKHELTHTGERRYQCLLCNEMFLNYQLLSTHLKQMHNQDPSGRKHKDEAQNQLYRLLPFKGKPYSFVSDEPDDGIPMINEDGTVQHVNLDGPPYPEEELTSSQSKMLRWDDIFVESDAHTRPGAQARLGSVPHTTNQMNTENTSTEFEFVIPETY